MLMQLCSEHWTGRKLRSAHSDNSVSAFFSNKQLWSHEFILRILTVLLSDCFCVVLKSFGPFIVTPHYRGVVRQNGLEDASIQMMNFAASTQTASVTCRPFFLNVIVDGSDIFGALDWYVSRTSC
jgi:hypothetical protein